MTNPISNAIKKEDPIVLLRKNGQDTLADALVSINANKVAVSNIYFVDDNGKEQKGVTNQCYFYMPYQLVKVFEDQSQYKKLPSLAFFDGLTDDQFRLGDTVIVKVSSSKMGQEYLAESTSEVNLLAFQSKELADTYLSEQFRRRVSPKLNDVLNTMKCVVNSSEAYCCNHEWLPGNNPVDEQEDDSGNEPRGLNG